MAECDLPKVKMGVRFPFPAYAEVAQLVEQTLRKGKVVGSNPTFGFLNLTKN